MGSGGGGGVAGYLRVFDWAKESLLFGCKSYYGALLTCAFRSDSCSEQLHSSPFPVHVYSLSGCGVCGDAVLTTKWWWLLGRMTWYTYAAWKTKESWLGGKATVPLSVTLSSTPHSVHSVHTEHREQDLIPSLSIGAGDEGRLRSLPALPN